MTMLETIGIFLLGFIPGLFSYVVIQKVRSRTRDRLQAAMTVSPRRFYGAQPYLRTLDYQHIEGVGYLIGDITCRFNARSAYIRCAVNPSGPCKGCSYYESIDL